MTNIFVQLGENTACHCDKNGSDQDGEYSGDGQDPGHDPY